MKKEKLGTLAGVHTHTHTLCLLNKIKEEKASITMFTLVACLFFIIVLLLVNIGLINKKTSQEKEIKEISKAYEINEQNMEDEYAKVAEENGYMTRDEIEKLLQNKKKEWDKEQIYKPGDIYHINCIQQGGYVTSARKEFATTIYLDKPISEDVKSITATVPGGIAIRQNGNYILGTSEEGKVTGVEIGKFMINFNSISFKIIVNSANTKTINNDAVGIIIRDTTLQFH